MEQGWELYNIYSDDDYTGSDRRRPEFNRLLKDAEAHKFDIILCKTQSRFTRELELVEKYIHGLFPIWGIRFISIVDNADTYDNILRLIDDPDVIAPIRFLREREIVHYQRFGEALRMVQDDLNSRNFYAFNPAFRG